MNRGEKKLYTASVFITYSLLFLRSQGRISIPLGIKRSRSRDANLVVFWMEITNKNASGIARWWAGHFSTLPNGHIFCFSGLVDIDPIRKMLNKLSHAQALHKVKANTHTDRQQSLFKLSKTYKKQKKTATCYSLNTH